MSYSVVNGKVMQDTATARVELVPREIAARLNELTELLEGYVAAVPAFRSKPIGGEGSDARLAQAAHVSLEDRARTALARARAPR